MEPVNREEWLNANHEFDKRMTRHEDRLETVTTSILDGIRMQGRKLDDTIDRLNTERANARAEEAAAKLARTEAEGKQREASATIGAMPRGGGVPTWVAWFIAAALTGKEIVPMLQQTMAGR